MKSDKSSSASKKELIFSLVIPTLAVILPAVIFVGYRAANLSFTHDESISFQLSSGVDTFARTPNNHILNTLLMKFFGSFAGKSELALRMPNVLAFVLYCMAGLAIIRNLKKPMLSVFFMAILVLNTLMLEFFGLARGYGLSLGLSMAGFYCMFMLGNQGLPLKKYLVYFVLALVFGQLAVYANLSALNLHAAMLAVLVLGLVPYLKFTFAGKNKNKVILIFTGIVLLDFVALAPAISMLAHLQEINELSVFGGSGGLMGTTVTSLISTFFYYEHYTPRIFSMVLIAVTCIFAIGGLWVLLNLLRKRFDNLSRTFLVLSLLLLAPVLQNYFFKIPFPVDRTALLYFPLFSLLFIFLVAEAVSLTRIKLVRTVIVAILIGVTSLIAYNSYKNSNVIYTYLWRYDTHNRQMLEMIAEDRQVSGKQDSVKVSCIWIFEPAINYYRISRKYDWMMAADREGFKKDADYFICLAENLNQLPGDSLRVLAKFEDVQTVLLKRQ